jgi:hypothetical protein
VYGSPCHALADHDQSKLGSTAIKDPHPRGVLQR